MSVVSQHLFENEAKYFDSILDKMTNIQSHFLTNDFPESYDVDGWFNFLVEYKSIQGNLGNMLSFVSTMMAKKFLLKRFEFETFDFALKPQGAPGLDLDIQNSSNERIICEIKNTVPYQKNFGSAQRSSIKKDLSKLKENDANYKFMMVTNGQSYDYLISDYYADLASGIEIVDLSGERSFIR